MIVHTPHGHPISYGVSRNMNAEDEMGRPVKVAMVLIEHENGYKQRHAIREDKIRFHGEGLIAQEVLIEAAKGGIEAGTSIRPPQ